MYFCKVKILYYLFIKPLSLLPFFILYRISDFLYLLVYYIVGYRKKVVKDNISKSLTHLSPKEQKQVIKAFYKHFCDIIIESLKLFSLDDQSFKKRFKFKNLAVLDEYHKNNQSYLGVGYHYNNWEYFATICNAFVDHQAYGIYTPIQHPFMSKIISESRGRYGIVLLAKKQVKEFFSSPKHPFVVFFGSDQSPSRSRKAYETQFLGRRTRVQFGLEKYATEMNLPVVEFKVEKVKRGYYETTVNILCDDPSATQYGEISDLHTHSLEQQILKAPQYWLWSHKRWKGMGK